MRIFLTTVVSLFFVTFAWGDVNLASVREELESFRTGVEAQLAAEEELDAKQTQAANKVLKAILKAEEVTDDKATKFLGRVTKVFKKAEQAAKRELDYSESLIKVDDAVKAALDRAAAGAEALGEVLAVDKHRTKVEKLLVRGASSRTAADALDPGAKRMKKLAAAAKKIVPASDKAEEYRTMEIEDGDLRLEIQSVTLNGQPFPSGSQVTGPEFLLEIVLNLPTEVGGVSPDAIVVVRDDGAESLGNDLSEPGEPLRIRYMLEPLVPGEYTLLIRGVDDERGIWLEGQFGIPLRETRAIDFEVLP
jgi:hypothetical protein